MKKLIDDFRMIQSEHMQVESIRHKLATFRDELERKLIFRGQLLNRLEVCRHSLISTEVYDF